MTRPILNQQSLANSIQACIENGDRLLDETYDLEFRPVVATRYFIAMIAQEEFAKAFVLMLIRENILGLSPQVLRAMKDHTCKQLLGMVMDYIIMHWDKIEDLEKMIEAEAALGDRFPPEVASAMNIFRHEKIGRWGETKYWGWSEAPDYHKDALSIANGKKDRRKQDSLYVRIDRNGNILSQPGTISELECDSERERAARYSRLMKSSAAGTEQGDRFKKVMEALRFLFQSHVSE